jgi:hypothetical protein
MKINCKKYALKVPVFIGSKFQQQAMKIKCIIVAFEWLTFFAPSIFRLAYREKEPFSVDGANKNGSKAVLADAP